MAINVSHDPAFPCWVHRWWKCVPVWHYTEQTTRNSKKLARTQRPVHCRVTASHKWGWSTRWNSAQTWKWTKYHDSQREQRHTCRLLHKTSQMLKNTYYISVFVWTSWSAMETVAPCRWVVREGCGELGKLCSDQARPRVVLTLWWLAVLCTLCKCAK